MPPKMTPIHILLVEDNEGDILLTREALEEGRIVNGLSVVRNGEEAIHYLDRQPPFESSVRPDLVLLDVNLPKKNGHEVLQYIKNTDEHKDIPVIMLTTSSADRDITLAYKNHANCYITKPVDVGRFMEVVAGIEDFWISIVELPNSNGK